MLSYGAASFIYSVYRDIFSDLLKIYPAKQAASIIAIASLRILHPGITARRLRTYYERSFISKYYAGVALSPNTVFKLYEDLGKAGKLRSQFYQSRADSVLKDHHIIIDGMLKQNSSKVNDLSNFSYKSKKKGHKEISVLYAFDIEEMEPICAQVFPGNSVDAASYNAFVTDNKITKGFVYTDKGFPVKCIKSELDKNPDLHVITPIKRNDKRINNNDMLDFTGVLTGLDDNVVFKKKAIKGGRYLYAYRSQSKAIIEETSYLSRRKKCDNFVDTEFRKKSKVFGVIVFESDQDLDPKTVYLGYQDRWLIELVFKRYKDDEDFDKTRVQSDFSVIGSELINFISTLITCRLVKKAEKAGLLNKMSYRDLMEDLSTAWRKVDAPMNEPETGDKYWVHTLRPVFDELEALGLSKPIQKPEPKRPRGRPKKQKPQMQSQGEAGEEQSIHQNKAQTEEQPKSEERLNKQ